MSSDIRQIVVPHHVAATMGGTIPKKRTRTTKKSQQGGTTEVPISTNLSGPTNVIKLGHVGGDLPPPPPMPSTVTPVVKPIQTTPPPFSNPSTPQTGGENKVVKVELKKKSATKKVHLQPKKAEPLKIHGKKTLKKPRKIILGISSMHRRLTRAKKAQTRVKEMPLDELKKLLIAKKLIKSTSTAPESILRQIAADAQIVADKAL